MRRGDAWGGVWCRRRALDPMDADYDDSDDKDYKAGALSSDDCER